MQAFVSIFNRFCSIFIFFSKKFCLQMAYQAVTWFRPFDHARFGNSFDNVSWFLNGKLNACYNMLDRHLVDRKDKVCANRLAF